MIRSALYGAVALCQPHAGFEKCGGFRLRRFHKHVVDRELKPFAVRMKGVDEAVVRKPWRNPYQDKLFRFRNR